MGNPRAKESLIPNICMLANISSRQSLQPPLIPPTIDTYGNQKDSVASHLITARLIQFNGELKAIVHPFFSRLCQASCHNVRRHAQPWWTSLQYGLKSAPTHAYLAQAETGFGQQSGQTQEASKLLRQLRPARLLKELTTVWVRRFTRSRALWRQDCFGIVTPT